MATINEVQVTWSAANFVSVATASAQVSDTVTFDAAATARVIQLKADNEGTPAAGDTVNFYVLFSAGDPDGAGADEFDTAGAADFLWQLDTNAEDPQIKTVPLSVGAKSMQLRAVNDSATNAQTVSATISETRA